ncbi:TniQ family protein [Paenibacillus glycanilyticus]|uniref:TniQ domain-containing protein n=1 Tax=Paenibacillus glycanilyticus TaxID=126569 RepID=A0ABQ6GJC0_9BACL|nr:TniQ family protein [Paenibacillus glycanilyticus]GLX70797.1 hypothetical protein MU1_51440 [Paenibacillus glycanilyticus]
MQLLIRPRPFPDESLRGYIVRLSEANGYNDSKMLFRYLGLQKYNKFENLLIPKKSLDLTRLSILCSHPISVLQKLTLYHSLFDDYENEIEENIKHMIWRRGTCAHKQRICPLCLKETRYHKNSWELSLFTICNIHKCLLIDECQVCHKIIDPYRDSLSSCKCGFNYADSKVVIVESDDQQFLHKIFYRKVNLVKENLLIKLPLSHSVYVMITLAVLIRGQRRKDQINKLDEIVEVFQDWPNSFFQFVDKVRIQKGNPIVFSKLKTFFEEHYYNKKLKFIVKAFETYLEQYWKTGYSNKILISDFAYSKVSSKITATLKRQNAILNKTGLNRREVARSLGIGLDQIEMLQERGVLKPIGGVHLDGNPNWLYAEDMVISIIEAFDNNIRTQSDAKEEINFYNTLSWFMKYGLKLADLVESVLNSKLAACKKSTGIGLNQYYFDKNEVLNFLKNGMLTIEDISNILRIKRSSVERWVKFGYIKGTKTLRSGNFTLISHQHFSNFREEYIAAVEIVRLHPYIRSTEKLLRELGRFGITPCNEKIIPGDVYLLKKSGELLKILESQLGNLAKRLF